MQIAFGYKGPDEQDERDLPLSAMPGAEGDPPEEHSLKRYIPQRGVLRQGKLGACVIHGFAQGVRICDIRDAMRNVVSESNIPEENALRAILRRPPQLTSRLFGYYNSRVQHGDENEDTGTYIRLTIKQANRLGRPRESIWPYDLSDIDKPTAKWKQRPPLMSYQVAADFKPASYYRIAQDDDARILAIKQAIGLAESPVEFGTIITQSFVDAEPGKLIVPRPDERALGGHAMLMIGYDALGPIIVNSWGDDWCEGGFAHLSWEYVVWAATRDLWAIDL